MDQKIEAIKVVSDDLERKRVRYEMLGLINTHGQTPEGRLELAAQYRVAEEDYFKARGTMRMVLDRYAASTESAPTA